MRVRSFREPWQPVDTVQQHWTRFPSTAEPLGVPPVDEAKQPMLRLFARAVVAPIQPTFFAKRKRFFPTAFLRPMASIPRLMGKIYLS